MQHRVVVRRTRAARGRAALDPLVRRGGPVRPPVAVGGDLGGVGVAQLRLGLAEVVVGRDEDDVAVPAALTARVHTVAGRPDQVGLPRVVDVLDHRAGTDRGTVRGVEEHLADGRRVVVVGRLLGRRLHGRRLRVADALVGGGVLHGDGLVGLLGGLHPLRFPQTLDHRIDEVLGLTEPLVLVPVLPAAVRPGVDVDTVFLQLVGDTRGNLGLALIGRLGSAGLVTRLVAAGTAARGRGQRHGREKRGGGEAGTCGTHGAMTPVELLLSMCPACPGHATTHYARGVEGERGRDREGFPIPPPSCPRLTGRRTSR